MPLANNLLHARLPLETRTARPATRLALLSRSGEALDKLVAFVPLEKMTDLIFSRQGVHCASILAPGVLIGKRICPRARDHDPQAIP